MNKREKKEEYIEVIEAWRTLYYLDLLNDKEKENIQKKIKTKYKSVLWTTLSTTKESVYIAN